jgi:hypothetical protein
MMVVSFGGGEEGVGRTSEVVGLTLHGAETGHLPHELVLGLVSQLEEGSVQDRVAEAYPADCVPVFFGSVRIRDLVILVVRGYYILEDSTTFEDLDLAPARVLISEGGNATVGVDLEKPGFLLLVLIEVYGHDLDEMLLVKRIRSVVALVILCTPDQAPPRR